jgi:ubiquinone/menaquinone biosynthesis C-methylase UbiE
MSFYTDSIYPALVERLGNPAPIQILRREIVPRADGTVLEIGVGSGLNFPYYDRSKVRKLFALEPNPGMRRRAEEQQRRTGLDVEFLPLPGERIPLDEASIDTVVSTFTLCTIAPLREALSGLARVSGQEGRFCSSRTASRPTTASGAGSDGGNRCITASSKASF